MATQTCSACGGEFDESTMFMSGSGPVCTGCDAVETPGFWGAMSGATKVGMVAAVGGLFLRFTVTNLIVPGTIDFGPLLMGSIGLLAAVPAALQLRRETTDPRQKMVVPVVALLAVVHILRGVLGVFF